MQTLKKYLLILAVLPIVACNKDDSKSTQAVSISQTAAYTNAVTIRWDAVGDAVAYEVSYNIGAVNYVQTTTDCQYTIEGLNANTQSSVRVRYQTSDGSTSNWSAAKAVKTAAFELSFTSFNVLGVETKAEWSPRASSVDHVIRLENNNPDVLCMQECSTENITNSLITMFSDEYDYQKLSVDGSPKLIFWKRSRFDKVRGGYTDMLLGDANYTSSDYATSRYANFVQLREKSCGKEFLVYDVHLKTNSSTESYQKLRYDCITALCPAIIKRAADAGGIPVLLGGDFNNYLGTTYNNIPSAPAACISCGFTEASSVARTLVNFNYRTSNIDMVNGVVTPVTDSDSRIDYLFYHSVNPIGVSKYETILDWAENSTTVIRQPVASDHLPVNATLHLSY